jgi:dienelactone hydrolase
VIARLFHAWERRLATIDTNRVVRPFEWGLDWLGIDADAAEPLDRVLEWSREAVAESSRFFDAPPASGFERRGRELTFPSAISTPYPQNDLVRVGIYEPDDRRAGQPRRAVVVIPQWNSDPGGHVGLCRLFARFGLTALRLSLPYHDARRPPELQRADYIVSSNIGRTLQANRQAVLDIKRTVDWLVREGFERIGIIGTSLGSCLAMLSMAHDNRVKAGAFNHVSPFFADVVWRGLSTRHVRDGLEGHLDLDTLRECWMPISPWPFISRVRGRDVLLVYARYDLTFPVDLSRKFIAEFRRQHVPHQLGVLPCGHYTTGKPPFSYLDGFYLTRFFLKNL